MKEKNFTLIEYVKILQQIQKKNMKLYIIRKNWNKHWQVIIKDLKY